MRQKFIYIIWMIKWVVLVDTRKTESILLLTNLAEVTVFVVIKNFKSILLNPIFNIEFAKASAATDSPTLDPCNQIRCPLLLFL